MGEKILQIVEKTKVCRKCESTKPFSEFHKHSNGLQPHCKPCRNKEYRQSRGDALDKRKTVILIEDGRACVSCKKEKKWQDFAKDIHGFNQKTSSCKQCRNALYKYPRGATLFDRPDKVKRLYGVTLDHIKQIFALQHGLCANRACGVPVSLTAKSGAKNRACIDHDHATGKFRAILCSSCNLQLGKVEKDKNKVLGLMEYLDKYN